MAARNKKVEERKIPELHIEGAKLMFRNFSGVKKQFNAEGQRNFNVVIPAEDVEAMRADGWNVKELAPMEEGDLPLYILKVNVTFGSYPPKVYMVANGRKTKLDEESISSLDWAEIDPTKGVDMIIRPYQYDVRGNRGVSAYLNAMYANVRIDEFEAKYFDMMDSAQKFEEPEG